MLMAVASMVSFMSIDVAGHYLDDNVTCFLNVSVSPRGLAGDQLPVSSYLLTLPFLLGTLADVFTNIAGEFLFSTSLASLDFYPATHSTHLCTHCVYTDHCEGKRYAHRH